LQWLQYSSKINCDNQNNTRRKGSRNFRNERKQYLKDKINELATNSKKKNIRDLYRGVDELKIGYQPGSELVKDENGDLLVLINILNRGRTTPVIECA
jgi:hypothetical protein